MSRFLFVVPPLTGHVNPTVSIAGALTARGHEVCWVGHPGAVRPLLPPGARLIELDDQVPTALREEMVARGRAHRGLAAFKFLWEDFFCPLAEAMLPAVQAAIAEVAPDVLISDQQALAGAFAARRAGLPWATLATTSAGVTSWLDELPRIHEWLDATLSDLQRRVGLEPIADPSLSPNLVLISSTPALAGPEATFPPHYCFVGPTVAHRPDTTDFPWEQLDDTRPRVLVSLGTVNAERGRRFYRVVAEALADASVQVIFAAPPDLLPELPPELTAATPGRPPRFICRSWVPQLQLLPRMSAVISHGGHNTVVESLGHGLPMVLAPIRDDQPVVARQVEVAGAGRRVRFGRVGTTALRAAVDAVLGEPSYRESAERIRDSFAQAGGADAAAQALIALAPGDAP